jgi:hypothetical protein
MLLPLALRGHTRGAILLGFGADVDLSFQEREAARGLAAIAGAALERHELLDEMARQVRQLDALYHITAELGQETDAKVLVNGLERVLGGHGVEVVGLALRDRELATLLGSDQPTRHERDAWRSGSRVTAPADGIVGVTMNLDGPSGASAYVPCQTHRCRRATRRWRSTRSNSSSSRQSRERWPS